MARKRGFWEPKCFSLFYSNLYLGSGQSGLVRPLSQIPGPSGRRGLRRSISGGNISILGLPGHGPSQPGQEFGQPEQGFGQPGQGLSKLGQSLGLPGQNGQKTGKY